jgi:hypothetical protein
VEVVECIVVTINVSIDSAAPSQDAKTPPQNTKKKPQKTR